jgi:hypothetical protein
MTGHLRLSERLLLSGVAESVEQAIYMAAILSNEGMSPKSKFFHVAMSQRFGPEGEHGIYLGDDEYLDFEERFNRGTFGLKTLGSA